MISIRIGGSSARLGWFRQRLVVSGLAVSLLLGVLFAVPASPAVAQSASQGDSQAALVVALGSSLSDVGTAASLVAAGKGDAVVFAESPDRLGNANLSLVREQMPERVYIVGGSRAVGAGVESQLKSLVPGVSVQRFAGSTRVETAALAADEALSGRSVSKIIVANGWSLPDVGAAAAAGAAEAVLYAERSELGGPAREVLGEHRPGTVLIAGGQAALSAGVEADASTAAGGAATMRLGGATRVETAAQSARRAFESGATIAVIANGWSLSDVGIAAALAAGLDGSAVMYSERGALGRENAGLLSDHSPSQIYVVDASGSLGSVIRAGVTEHAPSAKVTTVSSSADSSYLALGLAPPAQAGNQSVSDAGQRFEFVTAGRDHTCAIRSDRTVLCWGGNRSGQLNAPDGEFIAVAAALWHTCGLRTNGTVVCWGDDVRGQVSAPPGTFTAVSVGELHSCALRDDRRVICWGDDRQMQTAVPDLEFRSVSAGHNHTCGITVDLSVACWGANHHGQTDAPDGTFVSVSAGGARVSAHSCAVRTDGAVVCWGSNDFTDYAGLFGVHVLPGGQIDAPDGQFASVSAGGFHTCAVRQEGGSTCWGYRRNGATRLPAGVAFAQISAGAEHTCGIDVSGYLYCWGDNEFGQSDVPNRILLPEFTRVIAGYNHTCGQTAAGNLTCWDLFGSRWTAVPDEMFSQVSLGPHHACGITASGAVRCWGDNDHGQLNAPQGKFEAVTAAGHYSPWSCGLTVDESIACWGANDHGQSEAVPGRYISVTASTLTDVTPTTCALSAARRAVCWGANAADRMAVLGGEYQRLMSRGASTCGVRTDGAIDCYGPSGDASSIKAPGGPYVNAIAGIAGNSTFCGIKPDKTLSCWVGADPSSRLQVPPNSEFQEAVGNGHQWCAIGLDGALECWGGYVPGFADGSAASEAAGQIDLTQRFIDVDSNENQTCALGADHHIACFRGAVGENTYAMPEWLHGAIASITSGVEHVCALREIGTVSCWGSDYYGQSSPSVGKFVSLSAGARHTCGLRMDGRVECWGHRADALLDVPDGAFASVSAGASHSCGLREDGRVECWGSNRYGESDPPDIAFAQVEAGAAISCGLTAAGKVECWGFNESDSAERHGDVTILQPPDETFASISLTKHYPRSWQFYACGLTHEGVIRCWGSPHAGLIEPNEGRFLSVVAASRFGCGLKADGTVSCWGEADSGTSRTNVTTIREYQPQGTFTEISAAGHHVCGLRTDLALVCWGSLALTLY